MSGSVTKNSHASVSFELHSLLLYAALADGRHPTLYVPFYTARHTELWIQIPHPELHRINAKCTRRERERGGRGMEESDTYHTKNLHKLKKILKEGVTFAVQI